MNYLPELRKSLVRAAGRERKGARSRIVRALPAAVGVLVAVGVAVVALALAGHRHTPPAARPLPPRPTEPHLSGIERRYVNAAWLATVKRDKACNGFHGPELTNGSPSAALTTRLGVLRTRATPADELVALLRHGRGPWTAGAQLYINQIHRARSAFGADFYVIPAGNVTGQAGVPGRCEAEQMAALKHRIPRAPIARRVQILAAESRYLSYVRYLALHPDGVCATYLARNPYVSGGSNFVCATLTDFERYGVLANADAPLGGGVFWTVVPDGVAEVTLTFDQPRGATVTVRAVNNVIVAKIPASGIAEFPTKIALRSSTGHLIRSVHVNVRAAPTLCGYGC